MPHVIVMPSLSAGMEQGRLARWLKAPGDRVGRGEALAEVETDKATMELEAEQDGVLERVVAIAGTDVPVGGVVAYLLSDRDEVVPEHSVVKPMPASTVHPPVPTAPLPAATGRRVAASPLARRLARERSLPLDGLAGSGPRGRIVRIDVERALASAHLVPKDIAASAMEPAVADTATRTATEPRPTAPFQELPVSAARRVIARRLTESKSTIPHFYLEAECELDALLDMRARINANRERSGKVSVNDFVVKAAALALREIPEVNVAWGGDAVFQFQDVDVSVAVSTGGGLLTPIVRQADRKSVTAISTELRSLVTRAREGRLAPTDYQGGGFTVSNLGMHGVRSFSAIINPPQSCILAIGAAERRPVVRGEQCVPATLMSCTLSVDHRSVDGVLGARYLAAFKAFIEEPLLMFLV